ncbi:hypothetical protein B0H14DRAFT_3144247 [Mycena olivaceomarginata]|nr:hypothetical protein B0H14DRAFT_3144247 [Mycena olivaceomarginata]
MLRPYPSYRRRQSQAALPWFLSALGHRAARPLPHRTTFPVSVAGVAHYPSVGEEQDREDGIVTVSFFPGPAGPSSLTPLMRLQSWILVFTCFGAWSSADCSTMDTATTTVYIYSRNCAHEYLGASKAYALQTVGTPPSAHRLLKRIGALKNGTGVSGEQFMHPVPELATVVLPQSSASLTRLREGNCVLTPHQRWQRRHSRQFNLRFRIDVRLNPGGSKSIAIRQPSAQGQNLN